MAWTDLSRRDVGCLRVKLHKKYDVFSSVLYVSYTKRTDWFHRNMRQQVLCQENFVHNQFDPHLQCGHHCRSEGVQVKVSRRYTRALQSSLQFLEVNVITVWSTRNDITNSLVTTCTYSNDTFARPHDTLESTTPSAGEFVESGKSFLALRGYRCVFQASCSESNRTEMDESDTVSQLNFTYSSVKAIVS